MPTIYDVAKIAGVSPKTVSRVLNDATPVAQTTRRAVEAAIEQLGYVPSYAARTMRSNRSGLVGLISGAISEVPSSPELSGLPEIYIFQGIQTLLRQAGKTLLIADTGGDAATIPQLIKTFAEHRVEGVFYVAPYHQPVTLPPRQGLANFVIANGFDAEGTPAVVPDDYAGQKALVARLIEVGHRRIAYLTLPRDVVATRERTAGYIDALKDAGLPVDPALLRPAEALGQSPEDGRRMLEYALSSVLALPDPPTVICAGTDRLAMQFYGILRSRGMRVPEDISITGYDDYRLISETLYPPLTTVELPYVRMGQAAAKILLDRLAGGAPAPAPPQRIGGAVRWRDSVVPPQRA
ncbi:MAG: LacI family DNA-binding transcriptional regulator [Pseudomonadota bacterium]